MDVAAPVESDEGSTSQVLRKSALGANFSLNLTTGRCFPWYSSLRSGSRGGQMAEVGNI